MKSVRFFPFWNPNETSQVIGLIQMINYVLSKDSNLSHWIEIGSLIGESSTIFLGFDQIQRLDCVDKSVDATNICKNKHKCYIDSNRLYVHNTSSEQFAANIIDPVDVVYIDGDHSYQGAMNDIEIYFNKLKIGGFLCGHDYNSTSWPGVYSAVNDFKTKYTSQISNLITFKDTSWVYQRLI